MDPFFLRICHLFHVYLPHSMNWAYRLIRHTPDTEVSIAARWTVRNGDYFESDFRFFIHPLQAFFGWMPTDEWQWPGLRRLVAGLGRYSGLYAAALERFVRRWQPEVLHAHFGSVGVEHIRLAQKCGLPLVVSFYGYDLSSLPTAQPVYRAHYQRLFAAAAKVIVPGSASAATLQELGCPAAKLEIVRLSVDTDQFAYQPNVKQANSLQLAQIASFSEKKGHIYTLQAFHAALNDCPNMRLLLVGEVISPRIFQEARNYVAAHGLEDKVQWAGFAQHPEMPSILAGIDVFIHPSCRASDGNTECSPVAIIEAQAVGRPVISTRHADIPESVLDGVTGILTDEKDVAALSAAIRHFYHMENDVYQQFAHNARQHVADRFDVRANAKRLREIYGFIHHRGHGEHGGIG